MRKKASRHRTTPDAPSRQRPRLRIEPGGEPPRTERRDPLAYRVAPEEAYHARAERPAAAGHARAGRRNRRRVPPVVRWNRRLRSSVRFLTFVLAVEIVWLGFTSPLLRVGNVEVAGASAFSSAKISRIASRNLNHNVFLAPVGKTASTLAALPEVQSVSVKRKLPHTIAVTVTERTPLASVSAAGQWWAVDTNGRVFRKMNAPLPNYPTLYARVSARPVLGTKLKVPAVDAALKCLAMLPGLPISQTASLHVDGRNEAWLNNASGMKIRLGPLDDAPARLAVTERLLKGPNGPEILKKVLVLDMTTPDNEVYKRRENSDAYRLTSNST